MLLLVFPGSDIMVLVMPCPPLPLSSKFQPFVRHALVTLLEVDVLQNGMTTLTLKEVSTISQIQLSTMADFSSQEAITRPQYPEFWLNKLKSNLKPCHHLPLLKESPSQNGCERFHPPF